ncbi:MAG: hypothetical protein K5629_04300 [Eubacteriales bacterium]|nr:hypothetical protein [Eubacteriales bacterium]
MKRTVLLTLVLLICLSSASCGSSDNIENAAVIKKVGITLSSGDDGICRDLGAALAVAFDDISDEKTGYEISVIDAALSANGQYNHVELFVSSGFDTVVVDLIDESKAYDIARLAVENGVDVIFTGMAYPDEMPEEIYREVRVAIEEERGFENACREQLSALRDTTGVYGRILLGAVYSAGKEITTRLVEPGRISYIGYSAEDVGVAMIEILDSLPSSGDTDGSGNIEYAVICAGKEPPYSNYSIKYLAETLSEKGVASGRVKTVVSNDKDSAVEAIGKLLASEDPPDILFAMSDIAYEYAFEALTTQGMKTGRDIFLISVSGGRQDLSEKIPDSLSAAVVCDTGVLAGKIAEAVSGYTDGTGSDVIEHLDIGLVH